MNRDIYIVHGRGTLGVTRVSYDDNTPGDIIIVAGASQVDEAVQCAIEETNLDPLDFVHIRAVNHYKQTTIPLKKVHDQAHQTVEEFFRELWGDEVYDTEAASRDW